MERCNRCACGDLYGWYVLAWCVVLCCEGDGFWQAAMWLVGWLVGREGFVSWKGGYRGDWSWVLR